MRNKNNKERRYFYRDLWSEKETEEWFKLLF